ncbi:MAG: GNAT family acetyltransferase [Geobacteraceae bacterium]|nr:GNAT family acetyltransferase [Geobacteraceae bacterium]
MQLKLATLADIDGVLALHAKYQVNSIKEEHKKDGFVTTAFTKGELAELIEKESGLFIATVDGVVVAYVMAASWAYWANHPVQAYMIGQLQNYKFNGAELTTENSYQYGPICIDGSVRGSGILEMIFAFALDAMSKKYPLLVTFINKTNPRSFSAHTQKLGMSVLSEFQFNNNCYYWLACSTRQD